MEKHKKTFLISAAAIVLCLVVIWIIQVIKTDKRPVPDRAAYTVPKKIRYGFTVSNTTNRLMEKAEFWAYAPVKLTANQICEHIEASHPYELIEDEVGNQILHFTLDNLPPYGKQIVIVKANLLMSDQANRIPGSDMAAFLKPETYIESDHDAIKSKAAELAQSKVMETSKALFKWVGGHVAYAGYVKRDRGAYYAMTRKKGDCTEYMYLFAAMSRANSIPCRGVGGYVYKGDAVLKPADYHNWAEFYDDGIWHLSDPQKKKFMTDHADYIAIRIIRASKDHPESQFHRFKVVGDGLKVKMNS